MADWKKLASDLLLADGVLDADEAGLLETEIMADGVVDAEELEFLVGLRNAAKECSDEFETFFFEALTGNILEDGVIDAEEAANLREIFYADGVIDDNEKACLQTLKEKAKETCPEFDALFDECMG